MREYTHLKYILVLAHMIDYTHLSKDRDAHILLSAHMREHTHLTHVLVPAPMNKYTYLIHILVPAPMNKYTHLTHLTHILVPACMSECTHLPKDRNILRQVKSKEPERYFQVRNQLDKHQESQNNKVNLELISICKGDQCILINLFDSF